MVEDPRASLYISKTNENCNDCGTCLNVCPGHSVEFRKQGMISDSIRETHSDALIGRYLNCYAGHATDYKVRYNSSSGGLVTALLVFSLKKGLIDGALVTRMHEGTLRPQPFIAITEEEIISSSKSKYFPVPMNSALKGVLDGRHKLAVVGLPCHIHGIRKAETFDRKWKEKIVLHLGIFCHHTPSFIATETLLRLMGIERGESLKLEYRGQGWPGRFTVKLKSNIEKSISYPEAWKILGSPFFYPQRCILCKDLTNELTDISFGDAWLPRFMHTDNIGKSIIISRSKRGSELLKEAALSGRIKLEEISRDEVVKSQDLLRSKVMGLSSRIFLSKMLHEKFPNYDNLNTSYYYKDFLMGIVFRSAMIFGSNVHLRGSLPRLLDGRFYKNISSLLYAGLRS